MPGTVTEPAWAPPELGTAQGTAHLSCLLGELGMAGLEPGVEDPARILKIHRISSSMLKPAFAVSWWLLPASKEMLEQFTCALSKNIKFKPPEFCLCWSRESKCAHGLHAHSLQLLNTTTWEGQKVLNSHHLHDVCPVSELWSCHLDLNKIKLFFIFWKPLDLMILVGHFQLRLFCESMSPYRCFFLLQSGNINFSRIISLWSTSSIRKAWAEASNSLEYQNLWILSFSQKHF